MQRIIILCLISVSCAFGGSINRSSCGSTAGDCGGRDYSSSTSATQFSVLAHAAGSDTVAAWSYISISSDYTLTVFGGIGHLLVTPCLSAQQTHTGTPFSGSGSAYASMGSISVDAPSMSQELYSSCTKSNGIDFIFGVPQILTLSLGASASGQRGYENAYAQFEGRFLFRDQSLNNISGATFVLSPVAVPEPGTFLLLILAAIPAMQWRRMR